MKTINSEPEFIDRKLEKKLIKLTVFQFLTANRNSVTGRGRWCLMREEKKDVQETKNYRMSCINPN